MKFENRSLADSRKFLVRLLGILLILLSANASADEECIFEESAYITFIKGYAAEHRDSILGTDGRTLTITKDNESIAVHGGGCNHLGVEIESRSGRAYTEKQFLRKVLGLSVEFGSWLINTRLLSESIEKGNYQVIDGIYFIVVDAMTVFEASYDNKGTISIDFYIN